MADCKYAGIDFCDVSELNGFNLISPDTVHRNVKCMSAHAANASVHCESPSETATY